MTQKTRSHARSTDSIPHAAWTFLTNHAHVLICLSRDPDIILRDVAAQVGITERAVQRIVSDLVEEGYLERHKEGRQNTYRLILSKPLRHQVEKNCSIGELINLIK
jgi:DNA-binding MarR family transcriptional regulator